MTTENGMKYDELEKMTITELIKIGGFKRTGSSSGVVAVYKGEEYKYVHFDPIYKNTYHRSRGYKTDIVQGLKMQYGYYSKHKVIINKIMTANLNPNILKKRCEEFKEKVMMRIKSEIAEKDVSNKAQDVIKKMESKIKKPNKHSIYISRNRFYTDKYNVAVEGFTEKELEKLIHVINNL